ncbi:MAG: putative transposase [Micromonosporaceae bacterium]|nr:putative transposase [Micromonosporaceae bacterium]
MTTPLKMTRIGHSCHVKVAPSTVWEILNEAGIEPAPQRSASTWAAFLRSQANALLACDFIETVTLTGARHTFMLCGIRAKRCIPYITRILWTTTKEHSTESLQ